MAEVDWTLCYKFFLSRAKRGNLSMGYLAHVDGRCYKCKAHTDIFCDYCSHYICEEHRFERSVERSFKNFVFCEACEKAKKAPIRPKRTRGNPGLVDEFTESMGY
jgi:hypothetical protein